VECGVWSVECGVWSVECRAERYICAHLIHIDHSPLGGTITMNHEHINTLTHLTIIYHHHGPQARVIAIICIITIDSHPRDPTASSRTARRLQLGGLHSWKGTRSKGAGQCTAHAVQSPTSTACSLQLWPKCRHMAVLHMAHMAVLTVAVLTLDLALLS
jgi:hypothetical protein